MMAASRKDADEIISILLSKGANVNETSGSLTNSLFS
jgi:hypothetical protein